MKNHFLTLLIASGILATLPARAAEPAVDGLNAKLSAQYGSKDISVIDGSITFPIEYSFGAQVDLAAGNHETGDIRAIGVHLFQRDPNSYLFGLAASHTNRDLDNENRVSIEAEKFFTSFTVRSKIGYQRIDYFSGKNESAFGRLSASWYTTDDLALHVRAIRSEDVNIVGVGAEWQFGNSTSAGFAVFSEANYKENAGWQGLAGIRIYLDKPKSLKTRHRTSDPESEIYPLESGGTCPAGTYIISLGFAGNGCAPGTPPLWQNIGVLGGGGGDGF